LNNLVYFAFTVNANMETYFILYFMEYRKAKKRKFLKTAGFALNEPPCSRAAGYHWKEAHIPLTPPSPPEGRGKVVTLQQAAGNHLD
jgi:hypothetical protein